MTDSDFVKQWRLRRTDKHGYPSCAACDAAADEIERHRVKCDADTELIRQALEALMMLRSYTLSCEGLLNAKPAGQIAIADAAIAALRAELEDGK